MSTKLKVTLLSERKKARIVVSALLFVGFNMLAQPRIDSLFNALERVRDPKQEVDVLNLLVSEVRLSKPRTAMTLVQRVIRLSDRIGYLEGKAIATTNRGLLYWTKGRYDSAIADGLSALDQATRLNSTNALLAARLLLSSTYNNLGDFQRSRQYGEQALSLALQVNHGEGVLRAYNTLGNCYRSMSNDVKALRFYEKSLDATIKYHLPSFKPLPLNNIALIYLSRGDSPANIRPILDEALSLAKTNKNLSSELITRKRFATYFKNLHQYDSAERQLKLVEDLCAQLEYRSPVIEAYAEMIEIKRAKQQNLNAEQYSSKLSALLDSIFNLERARAIAALEDKYESSRKDQMIRVLEQEKEIKNLWILFAAGGAMFMAVIFILIFILQRTKVRTAKRMLSAEQMVVEKLREVDRMKSSFIANISHEFRTPLTLILAPVEMELAKAPSASGSSRESLLMIQRSASRLLELINQLLDLSKAEAGKMELSVVNGDLDRLLNTFASSFDSLADKKQIKFAKTIDIRRGDFWYDADKLEKVVCNLLSNAFKFTPAHGAVSFEASVVNNDTLQIQVKDTGSGIPKASISSIFEPFYQGKSNPGSQGTGLGLSIVKEMVKIWRGRIEVTSDVGVGTVFNLSLPVAKRFFKSEEVVEVDNGANTRTDEIESADARSEVQLSNQLKVLVVEDNVDMLDYISLVLKKNRILVEKSLTAEEALAKLNSFRADVIISDIMLPGMSGTDLVDALKTETTTSEIPVILMTASYSKAKPKNTDAFLTKPFSSEDLIARVRSVTSVANLFE